MKILMVRILLLLLNKLNKIENNAKGMVEVKLLDVFLPPIAYVRFVSGENKACRPHDLYNVFSDSLNTLKMVQSFVYYKGCLLHSIVDSTYICEYQYVNGIPKFKVTKNRITVIYQY